MKAESDQDLSQMRIEDMTGFLDPKVGAQVRHVLMRHGILTLEQLLEYSEEDLLDLQRFGMISLAQLTVKLKSMGLELKRKQQGRSW